MWSDYEYYVSLGNTPWDVLGPDAISYNIISAEFLDDNDELIDADEFIGLNKYRDPDMGLNFQYMQA